MTTCSSTELLKAGQLRLSLSQVSGEYVALLDATDATI
jgi:hypothetical protein